MQEENNCGVHELLLSFKKRLEKERFGKGTSK
jgi:hypothetical protein